MKRKLPSIDLISYFLKYLFLIILLLTITIFMINIIDFINLLASPLERKSCIYKSIINKNNLVSDFLITHNYNVYGLNSYNFLEGSTSILTITLVLKIFNILKYLYYSITTYFIFKLLNKYSRNDITNNRTNKWLLIISLLIIFYPYFLALEDLIGCLIINKLPIKDPLIYFRQFDIYYLIIGLSILMVYLFNYLKIKHKSLNNYLKIKKLVLILFVFIFAYFTIINLINLINVLTTESQYFEYNKLLQNKNSFIALLVNNSFELFGNSYRYLGYYSNFKTSITLNYIFQTFANLLFLITYIWEYLIIKNKKEVKEIANPIIKGESYRLIIYILMLILNFIVLVTTLNIAKVNNSSFEQLNYSLVNLKYLLFIIPSLFVIVISISYSHNNEIN